MKIIIYDRKNFLFQIIFYSIIILLQILNCNALNCNKARPIEKDNACVLTYCTEEEFNSSTCIINNQIIKTQWLNNILPVSDMNYRYINPFLTSNNDLIIQTTSVLGLPTRNYFGITNEGRDYFTNSEGEETPYFSIDAEGNDDLYKYEGTAASIQIGNNENNYFLSIGNNNGYVELIDYKSSTPTITRKLSSQFYYVKIISEISTIFLMKRSNSDDETKYYIIHFITYLNSEYYFMCKIYYFSSTDINSGYTRVVYKGIKSANRRISSCYQSLDTLYIFCFYQNPEQKFKIIIFEPNLELEQICDADIEPKEKGEGEGNEYIFFKGVYLVGNAGFFLYYKTISSAYPSIALREWDNLKAMKKYKEYEVFTIEKYKLNSHVYFNDLIRIKKYQICFSSISENKEILVIIIFNFYDDYSQFTIRYYIILMYNLYNKKFLLDLKLMEFGNYLSLTASFCSNDYCSSNSHNHYSYLIIFGYPNSNDINFDYIQYLFDENQNIANNNINFIKYINNKKIDNNIFGYIYKGVKILSVPDNLSVKSVLNNNIRENYLLNENENITISISLDNQNTKDEYIIKYALIYSDPSYTNLYDYVDYADNTYNNGDESSYYSGEYIDEYVGRASYFKILKNGKLTTNCGMEDCNLCLTNTNDNCIACNNEYYKISGKKNCKFSIVTTLPKPIPETTSPIIPTTIITTIIHTTTITTKVTINTTPKETSLIDITEEYQGCLNKDILNNKCHDKITNEQIGEVYDEIKNILKNTNETLLLITENVAFHLTNLKDQDSQNINISSVDLANCENILKKATNLSENDDLIILKIDIKSEDLKVTYTQYEVYHPYTKQKLNLDLCSKETIYIYSPIVIDSNMEYLYGSLGNSGYNLFDSNDAFYNDICSPYTSENGTDIPMNDRKNEILNNAQNYTMCQNNCTFLYYNTTTKKAKCDCLPQINETKTDTKEIDFKSKFKDSLISTIKNSNFLVLKCYKLTFSLEGQKNNIGSYIMSFVTFIFIILMVIYFIFGGKNIHIMIQKIIGEKKGIVKINSNFKSKFLKTETKAKITNNSNNKKVKNNKNIKKNDICKTQMDVKIKNIKEKIKNNIKSSNKDLIKKEKEKEKKAPPKKMQINKNTSYNILKNNSKSKGIYSSNIELPSLKKAIKILNTNMSKKYNNNNKKLKNKINNKIRVTEEAIKFKKTIPFSSIGLIKVDKKPKKQNIEKKDNLEEKPIYLNDQELNTLEYEEAINIDKRSYFQYYFSLLKKKHLILFTVWPSKDYNLIAVKISLFLLSFSLYFTINGFFFTDESMHNLYVNNGSFDILFNISQIIYSSIIPSIVYTILKLLSLSEKDLLKLKQIENTTVLYQKSKRIEICLKIKFIIFFVFSFFIMVFFWYFISCFCAVYKNTQIILIEDTFLSFGISMLYPVGLNLLPGLFRIPAIRDKQKKKKCMYKISLYISLLI